MKTRTLPMLCQTITFDKFMDLPGCIHETVTQFLIYL